MLDELVRNYQGDLHNLCLQQQNNFELFQNALQIQRLEDERRMNLDRLYTERQRIQERNGAYYNDNHRKYN